MTEKFDWWGASHAVFLGLFALLTVACLVFAVRRTLFDHPSLCFGWTANALNWCWNAGLSEEAKPQTHAAPAEDDAAPARPSARRRSR